jgi:hypothetical protein
MKFESKSEPNMDSSTRREMAGILVSSRQTTSTLAVPTKSLTECWRAAEFNPLTFHIKIHEGSIIFIRITATKHSLTLATLRAALHLYPCP